MNKNILKYISLFMTLLLLTSCTGKKYKSGTYTGESQGYGGSIIAEVEFDENKILNIDIKANKETIGIGDTAIEKIKNEILEKQSTDIDSISSATVTSEAVKKAVNNCIIKASNE